jgi:hypothetical protein
MVRKYHLAPQGVTLQIYIDPDYPDAHRASPRQRRQDRERLESNPAVFYHLSPHHCLFLLKFGWL